MEKAKKTSIKRTFQLSDVHYFYKKALKGIVSQTVYGEIQREFFGRVFEEVIYPGKIAYLPFGFGKLYIKSRRPKVELDMETFEIKKHTLRVDYGATNKLWAIDPVAKAEHRRIYHENTHSMENIYRFVWNHKYAKNVSGLHLVRFKVNRPQARGLNKYIRENGNP